MIFVKALLLWLAIVPCAVVNGGLRDIVTEPLLGAAIAQPLSGVLLSGVIFAVAYFFIPKIGKGTPATYIFIGLMWFALTNLLDLSMILASGQPLSDFLVMFDITTGNLWSLVVIVCLASPILAAKLRKLI
jgi:hypothetical protein